MLRTAERFAEKLARDCFELLEVTLEKSEFDRSFFFFSLHSLGVFLEQFFALGPGFLENKEIQKVLARVFKKIQEKAEFEDRLKGTFNNFEWNSFFSLFLIVCQFGTAEKLEAYQCLKTVFSRHPDLLDVLCEEQLKSRVFRDTVDVDNRVRALALQLILNACEHEKCRENFVQSRLVFNLFTKVFQKDPQAEVLGRQIVRMLTLDRKIWQKAEVAEELARVVQLAKDLNDQDLKNLVQVIQSD